MTRDALITEMRKEAGMTLAEFRAATHGEHLPAGTTVFIDHHDRTVYSVVTWAHGERWFDEYVAPGDARWPSEYRVAVLSPATLHYPRRDALAALPVVGRVGQEQEHDQKEPLSRGEHP
jgi:hypothetical protein